MPALSVTNTFVAATLIESAEANQNFQDIVTWANANVIQKDASVAFTATPSGPALDPVSTNQFTRKGYVDQAFIVATCTTGALTAGASQAVTPAAGNWLSSNNRGGFTLNANGFLLPTTGTYYMGFYLFFGGLSNLTQVIGNQLVATTSVAADESNWSGLQPSSTVSGATMARGTAGDQVKVQYSLGAGTGAAITAVMWASKVPGTS